MLAVGYQEQALDRRPVNASDDALRSWKRLGEAANLLHGEINTALVGKYNLTIPDVHILHTLNTDPRRCVRMGALAETLVLAPSRVTWQVQRLEDRGLVRRVRSDKDKRVVVVGLTRKGHDHLQPALRTYSMLIRRHYLTPLTREQMTALGDCARRVSDALKRADTS